MISFICFLSSVNLTSPSSMYMLAGVESLVSVERASGTEAPALENFHSHVLPRLRLSSIL
ncbi:MAG: hypothetical protein BWY84_01091 [Candidatus Aerophobetes bacterium ADurb.Bin490]|nr:MAG: hypothetical protein BWY84_01091 [Candidatus Aerophobetes bacterium ADurb.Bin490]